MDTFRNIKHLCQVKFIGYDNPVRNLLKKRELIAAMLRNTDYFKQQLSELNTEIIAQLGFDPQFHVDTFDDCDAQLKRHLVDITSHLSITSPPTTAVKQEPSKKRRIISSDSSTESDSSTDSDSLLENYDEQIRVLKQLKNFDIPNGLEAVLHAFISFCKLRKTYISLTGGKDRNYISVKEAEGILAKIDDLKPEDRLTLELKFKGRISCSRSWYVKKLDELLD